MDDELIAFLVMGTAILIASLVPIVGIIGGRVNEYRHYRSLERREEDSEDVMVTQIKTFPAAEPGTNPPTLIFAETVIASDYLKTFLASVRGVFGGEVKSYQKMQERARRESLLRLIESARAQGYNAICNVRMESADIGGGAMNRGKYATPMAAILASATAYNTSSRR